MSIGAKWVSAILTMILTAGYCYNANARLAAGNTGGGCYNLNIIAVKSKSADLTGTSGHSLFVLQNGNTKIGLGEGDFNVVDRNGTDGSARFTLPNPDPTNSGTTAYSVFARLLGKPGSTLKIATCALDADGVEICSQDTLNMSRVAGTSKFLNVSQQLLYVYADIDADGDIDRVPLFDSRLQDYFWNLDSTGRMHAQLRFCPVATTVANP